MGLYYLVVQIYKIFQYYQMLLLNFF